MKNITIIKKLCFFRFPLLFLFLTSLIACSRFETVKVGFISDLSSRNSEIGIQARNGLMMAVDEINNKGGVRGRQIEVLLGNHKGDKELCKEIVRDHIDRGAHIIIGPMISSMATTVISAALESDLLVIGPTITTDALTGIDDNFLRVVTTASTQGKSLAQSLLSLEIKQVTIILDQTNYAYSRAVADGFRSALNGSDVNISENLIFHNKEDFPFIVQELEKRNPEAILFAASGIDTAGIIQLYGKNNEIPQLFGGSWVKNGMVNEYGGRMVEGMILSDYYTNPSFNKREMEFNEHFIDLYSVESNFASRSAYESLFLFAQAFDITGSLKSSDLKTAILGLDNIKGVTENFRIDEFGDGIRTLSIFVIKNGKFKVMNEE